jgi:hypothetical protein
LPSGFGLAYGLLSICGFYPRMKKPRQSIAGPRFPAQSKETKAPRAALARVEDGPAGCTAEGGERSNPIRSPSYASQAHLKGRVPPSSRVVSFLIGRPLARGCVASLPNVLHRIRFSAGPAR